MALGQQQADATVVEHIGQAIPWIFRVQRYVGTAGLENRQQPQDHFHGTLDGDTHQHIRADTLIDQPMRQPVGPGVELGVGQALLAENQRRGVRGPRHLLFDQAVHTAIERVLDCRGVPLHQHAPTFVSVQ